MLSRQFLGISMFQILNFLRAQLGFLIGTQPIPLPLCLAAAAAVIFTAGDILAVIAGIGQTFHVHLLLWCPAGAGLIQDSLQNADYISNSSQSSERTAGV